MNSRKRHNSGTNTQPLRTTMHLLLLCRSHLLRRVTNRLLCEVLLVLVEEVNHNGGMMHTHVAQHPAHTHLRESVGVLHRTTRDARSSRTPLTDVEDRLCVHVAASEVQHGHAGRALPPGGRIFP